MKVLILFSILFLLSCKVFSQTEGTKLDTTYLYFPFTILFDYGHYEITQAEKDNLNYILDKYYYPYKDSIQFKFNLTALECEDEIKLDNKISIKRLFSVYEYLTQKKSIKKDMIILTFGAPNPKICENKDRQGVLIQYW